MYNIDLYKLITYSNHNEEFNVLNDLADLLMELDTISQEEYDHRAII